jgi:hypothetical protein
VVVLVILVLHSVKDVMRQLVWSVWMAFTSLVAQVKTTLIC